MLMKLACLLLSVPLLTNGVNLVQFGPIKLKNNSTFWALFQPQPEVSKFPPIIEYFAQKIQAQFSNYVHEDLSRPPTWDKPTYTLSAADQLFFYPPETTTMKLSTTTANNVEKDEEYVEVEDVGSYIIKNNSTDEMESPNNQTNVFGDLEDEDEDAKNTTSTSTEKYFEVVTPPMKIKPHINVIILGEVDITPQLPNKTYGEVFDPNNLIILRNEVSTESDHLNKTL
ncbi:unnamed protein product [Brassicogethes aeneus]|uniref:Uncharacterized protein n=1 Tax=Brassicogethes aeneus TaxID=1431903 RepID=A0A9P0B7P0_BRAAE|nr:unnamed protein product [Brassicogethes aeneus]